MKTLSERITESSETITESFDHIGGLRKIIKNNLDNPPKNMNKYEAAYDMLRGIVSELQDKEFSEGVDKGAKYLLKLIDKTS